MPRRRPEDVNVGQETLIVQDGNAYIGCPNDCIDHRRATHGSLGDASGESCDECGEDLRVYWGGSV